MNMAPDSINTQKLSGEFYSGEHYRPVSLKEKSSMFVMSAMLLTGLIRTFMFVMKLVLNWFKGLCRESLIDAYFSFLTKSW